MYQVEPDLRSQQQIDALPAAARESYGEVHRVLELVPWNGDSLNEAYPEAPVRTMTFGRQREGLVTYLILEDQRRVDVLDLIWLGAHD